MTTNFEFLKKEPKFNSFADVAISAEKVQMNFVILLTLICLNIWNLLEKLAII